MVSDQEIASCVESLLRGTAGGPGEVSLAAVLQQAEAKFGVDLSHKAQFIRDQMDLFFGPRLQQPQPKHPQAAAPPPPPPPQQAPVVPPATTMPQPQAQQIQTQPQQLQLHQMPALQPQLIFQAMPQLPAAAAAAAATIPAVSSPPAVPAMAFYPPPPLAFRYTTGLGGVATGGTVSFQQPAPGVGGTAPPTAAPQVAGDNKER
jgi:upstream activation factor subunit UAF30